MGRPTLADLGAEVVKVERPGTGDDTRSWGPPFAADAHGEPTTDSPISYSANRGKKSVVIDMAEPARPGGDPRDGADIRRADRELQGRSAGEVRSRLRRAGADQSAGLSTARSPASVRPAPTRPRRLRLHGAGARRSHEHHEAHRHARTASRARSAWRWRTSSQASTP